MFIFTSVTKYLLIEQTLFTLHGIKLFDILSKRKDILYFKTSAIEKLVSIF